MSAGDVGNCFVNDRGDIFDAWGQLLFGWVFDDVARLHWVAAAEIQ